MEIKVGDKVRVSKNAPKLLFTRSICNYPEYVFEVRAIEDDFADIYYGAGKIPLAAFVIPTKYLIKVEDEAKEPKFNVGDKVVVHYSTGDKMGRIQEVLYDGCYDVDYGGGCTGHHIIESRLYPYTEPTAPTIKVGDRVCCYNVLHIKGSKKEDYMGYVASITDMGITIQLDKGGLVLVYHESDLELVQPTEQTEAEEVARIRQLEAELDEFRKAELDRVLHPEKYYTYEVTIDNVAVNWQRYEADLAKEIAVKLSKPNENKPGYVADYAVSVAKAVVENLKKK